MLDKINKLEEKLNSLLTKILNLCLFLMHKLIPAIVFQKCHEMKLHFFQSLENGKNISKANIIKVYEKLKGGINFVLSLVDRLQKFPLKTKIWEFLKEIRDALLQTPLRSYVEKFSNFLQSFLKRFEKTISVLASQQFMIAFSALCMILFGTYNIYISGQDIYRHEFTGRSPASADQYLERPAYKKFEKRTMKVLNIRVPIFVESVKAIRSVTIDFSVRTSTRFARYYLESYEYKLKDYFFMTVEPVISSFPIETEGKLILKEKIQDELNNFLKERNVEGEVLEVDILFIVAS